MPAGVYPRTKEHSEKISRALIGRKMSVEQKTQISKTLAGRKLSEETRRKISLSQKGKLPWNTGLTKLTDSRVASGEQLSKHKRGVPRSEETKNKLRLAHKGKSYHPPSKSVYKKGNKPWNTGKSGYSLNLSPESRELKRQQAFSNLANQKFKDTEIELLMEKELLKRNILHLKQHYVKGIAVVDFYLPEYNVVIECDGYYWHNYPDGLHSDRIKTHKLFVAGYKVYRFWEQDIHKSVSHCVDEIIFKEED